MVRNMEAHIRKAIPDDAKEVAYVLNSVIHEGKYTAFTRPFGVEEERLFISSLRERSAIFVAQVHDKIVGIQVIDQFADYADSMQHVAMMGTCILSDFRGHGIGRRLAEESFRFHSARDVRKRSSN